MSNNTYDYIEVATGEELYEEELTGLFDTYLDEVADQVNIGTLTYNPSEVLRQVDPTAYRETFLEWINAEIEDGVYEEYDPSSVE